MAFLKATITVKRVERVTYKGQFGTHSGGARQRRVADDIVTLKIKLRVSHYWVPPLRQRNQNQVSASCLEPRGHKLVSSVTAIMSEEMEAKPRRPKLSRMIAGVHKNWVPLFAIFIVKN